MFASQEVLSLDEIYKAQNEINQIKRLLEREALFGEGKLPQSEIDEREREYNYSYYQLALTAPQVSIYTFIGKPQWYPDAELTDAKITCEVDRLLLLLAHNGIEISISDPHQNADDRRLYRFITEMVFPKEISEIRLPGMSYSIDYNYYCPDSTHSCIFVADELLSGLFGRNYHQLEICLAKHFFVNNNYNEDLYNHVVEKFDAYKSYIGPHVLVDWSIEEIELDATQRKGIVHLILRYGLNKNKKPLFTDRGTLVCYGNENNWWSIHCIDLPGLYLD